MKIHFFWATALCLLVSGCGDGNTDSPRHIECDPIVKQTQLYGNPYWAESPYSAYNNSNWYLGWNNQQHFQQWQRQDIEYCYQTYKLQNGSYPTWTHYQNRRYQNQGNHNQHPRHDDRRHRPHRRR